MNRYPHVTVQYMPLGKANLASTVQDLIFRGSDFEHPKIMESWNSMKSWISDHHPDLEVSGPERVPTDTGPI